VGAASQVVSGVGVALPDRVGLRRGFDQPGGGGVFGGSSCHGFEVATGVPPFSRTL